MGKDEKYSNAEAKKLKDLHDSSGLTLGEVHRIYEALDTR